MNRTGRATIARETVAITERGYYVSPSGRKIDIRKEIAASVAGSRLYRPDDFPQPMPTAPPTQPRVEITGETTLAAARRLAGSDAVALNFASAKNPGGGFLNGSEAQEESLACASALYPCLTRHREMYDYNRALRSCLYSEHMIYSSQVPVFRDDAGALLNEPYTVSIITAPAVNAGAVLRSGAGEDQLIRPVMEARLANLLWVAHQHGHRTIILGAWGCGVFRNDPWIIAQLFEEALGPNGRLAGWFDHIVYAVYDRSERQDVMTAFRKSVTPE